MNQSLPLLQCHMEHIKHRQVCRAHDDIQRYERWLLRCPISNAFSSEHRSGPKEGNNTHLFFKKKGNPLRCSRMERQGRDTRACIHTLRDGSGKDLLHPASALGQSLLLLLSSSTSFIFRLRHGGELYSLAS